MWIGIEAPALGIVLLDSCKIPMGSVILIRDGHNIMIGRTVRSRYKVPHSNPPRYYFADGILTAHGNYGTHPGPEYLGTFIGEDLIRPNGIRMATPMGIERTNEYQQLLTRAVSHCRAGDGEWANILCPCNECHFRTRCGQVSAEEIHNELVAMGVRNPSNHFVSTGFHEGYPAVERKSWWKTKDCTIHLSAVVALLSLILLMFLRPTTTIIVSAASCLIGCGIICYDVVNRWNYRA